MDDRDLYWLAGLIEGEGNIGFGRAHGYRHPRITVNMADRDVIKRACDLTGCRVAGPYRASKNESHAKMWRWRIMCSRAERLLTAILPIMGIRRAKRIRQVLAACKKDRAKAKEVRKEVINRNRKILGRTALGRFTKKEKT